MYIIYKTTCLLNGKIYIGQHKVKSKKTLDPWYIGSGYTRRMGTRFINKEENCKIKWKNF